MKVFYTLVLASFSQLLRERILYNVIFVSLFLLFIGYLAALLVFGHQDRVMLHLGLMINSLAIFLIAASSGSKMIRHEHESRFLYLTLAKPVSRPIYFFSKWIGVGLFLAMNLSLLTLVLGLGLYLTGGHFTWVLFQSLVLAWVEALLIAAAALFLSLFTSSALTVMITLSYFLIAHNLEQIEYLSKHGANAVGWIHFIPFPKAHLFLLDTRVYYEQILTASEWMERSAYGLLWALGFILLGNAVFYRKNL